MLGSSASLTADDVCIKCRVRRSPYALNPEFDEEREMQCTLRSWNQEESGGLFSSSARSSQHPSPAHSEIGSPTTNGGNGNGGGGKMNSNEITGSGIASTWLAQQQKEQGGSGGGGRNGSGGELSSSSNNNNNGLAMMESRESSTTLKLLAQDNEAHHHGPEILFKPVHDNALKTQVNSGQRTFSHIRSRSVGRSRTPMTSRGRMPSPTPPLAFGRPPVSTVEAKKDDGSHSGSRSSSRQRPSSVARSRSRGRRVSSALAAAAVFDSTGLNDSGSSNPTTLADSPYNSDGEGCGGGGNSPNLANLPAYRIPTSDIIVVDVHTEQDDYNLDGSGGGPSTNRIYLTTISHGYFEVTFDSSNSHSVMLAFLKNALPPERVNRKVNADDGNTNQTIFGTASCCADMERESFDMENFTAKELNDTVKREGIFDKLKRRITHIAGQCGDLSEQLSDTVCGVPSDASGHHTVDYSMGAFDSTITTPVHNNKPRADLAVLPDEPKISFEATPSKDSTDSFPADIQITDELQISSEHLTRPTLHVKEPSTERILFNNNSNNGPSTPIGTSGSDGGSVTDDHNDPHRSPDQAGGAMMQSVDI